MGVILFIFRRGLYRVGVEDEMGEGEGMFLVGLDDRGERVGG